MPRLFFWHGINCLGEPLQGYMEAQRKTEVKRYLYAHTILPRKIKKQYYPKIKDLQLTLFCKQLLNLLNAGVSLVQALSLMQQTQSHIYLKFILEKLVQHIASGMTLAESLNQYPRAFNTFFCHLIKAGEQSATLTQMLTRLSDYFTSRMILRQNIKKACTYPAVIFGTGICITLILLVRVVPEFEAIFQQFNAPLPWLTACIMTLSNHLKASWMKLSIISVGCSFGFYVVYTRQPIVKQRFNLWLLSLPGIGRFIQKTILVRFSSTFSILLSAGMSMLDILPIAAEITAHPYYRQACENARNDLLQGLQLTESFIKTHLFPELALYMMKIGEETGELDSMLQKMAEYYQAEINLTLDTLSRLLEPLIMALLGILIGGLVMVLYLPVLTLGSIIS